MQIMADVKCYHCSYVSGELIGERNGDLRPEFFHPSPGYTRPLPRHGDVLRCGRCDGPVYLEDVRDYRPHVVEPMLPAGRVRPRHKKLLASAMRQSRSRSGERGLGTA